MEARKLAESAYRERHRDAIRARQRNSERLSREKVSRRYVSSRLGIPSKIIPDSLASTYRALLFLKREIRLINQQTK